jgi:hypothetical protein
MNMLYSAFQARVSKQATQPDQPSTPATDAAQPDPCDNSTIVNAVTNSSQPANQCSSVVYTAPLPSGYSACLTTGYQVPPAYTTTTIHPHYPNPSLPPPSLPPAPGQKPQDLTAILSLPPPPPPPGSPYTHPSDPNSLSQQPWQFPPPGQALLFPPVQLAPGLWPSQHAIYMTPSTPLPSHAKRKVPGLTDGPESQTFKRQKLCGSS